MDCQGESVGLLGESGSGRDRFGPYYSWASPANGRATAGRITWQGYELLGVFPKQQLPAFGRENRDDLSGSRASLNPRLSSLGGRLDGSWG